MAKDNNGFIPPNGVTEIVGANKKKEPKTFFDFVFPFLAILASTVSGYATYKGYSNDLPTIFSLPISIIIFLSLLSLNFKIKKMYYQNKPLRLILIAFSVIFVFSFISNVNAIYSISIEGDITRNTHEESWGIFDKVTEKINNSLLLNQEYIDVNNNIKKINVELQNLNIEVTDPRNPGMGKKAIIHFKEIERILETKITRLKSPPKGRPLSEYEAYFEKLKESILSIASKKYETEKYIKISSLLKEIEERRVFHYGKLIEYRDAFTKEEDKEKIKDYPTLIIDKMKDDLESIKTKASNLINIERYDFPTIDEKADNIGSFDDLLRNIVRGVEPFTIVIAVILSIFFDITVPLLSVAMQGRRRYRGR